MKGLLFTYGMTYGGAVVSLFNPFVGLLIYVCFAIVKPESMWYWSVPEGNYSRIVAVGLLLGWMAKGFGSWDFGRARGLVYALLAFWVWSVVGIFIGINADRSVASVEAISKIILPFIVGITTIKSVKQIKLLAWVIVLSEGYVAFEFNLSYLSGYNRLWEEGFGNMDNNCNAIALVCCTGVGFFLAVHTKEWWLKALGFGAVAVMVNAIFFSYSRGGILALFITLPVVFLLIPKRPKDYLFFLMAVLLVVRLAGAEVMARFDTVFATAEERDASATSRLRLWEGCWDSMLEHPLGLGADNFPLVVEKYGYATGKEAHTLWLTVGAEFGFPGLVCLVLFFWLCVVKLWPISLEGSRVADPWARHFARMSISALVGFAVAAQFVSVKYLEHPYYIALVGAAALKLLSRPATGARHPDRADADWSSARETNAGPVRGPRPSWAVGACSGSTVP
jgi:probable O-glycosylation ligase (exosortase A-associated)